MLVQSINMQYNKVQIKLQKAMGHSSLAISLTYLRGLEVSELEESDMPMV
jgi:hypothetical protein|tara:strand:- start:296 stop:445 length:150 start_codon:yes stop_codon:yes gene_type:complete